jgi:methionyl-tRNA formyltransferase
LLINVLSELPPFILLGTGGHYTWQVLKCLIDGGCLPSAYVQYGAPAISQSLQLAHIPVEVDGNKKPILTLLQDYSIPVFYQSRHDLTALIKGLKADFMLVACWPERIHQDTIRSVNCAAVNLHPSLLPAFRGYDPITEQIASGHQPFGVSLHLLSEQFDCGDIIMQEEVMASVSDSRETIEALCAEKGAHLFKYAMQIYSQPGWTLIKQA